MTRVKIQYGKDLASLNQDHKRALNLSKNEITEANRQNLYYVSKKHEGQLHEFKFTFEVELNRIVAEKKRELRLKTEYF